MNKLTILSMLLLLAGCKALEDFSAKTSEFLAGSTKSAIEEGATSLNEDIDGDGVKDQVYIVEKGSHDFTTMYSIAYKLSKNNKSYESKPIIANSEGETLTLKETEYGFIVNSYLMLANSDSNRETLFLYNNKENKVQLSGCFYRAGDAWGGSASANTIAGEYQLVHGLGNIKRGKFTAPSPMYLEDITQEQYKYCTELIIDLLYDYRYKMP